MSKNGGRFIIHRYHYPHEATSNRRKDPETGGYSFSFPELPGCASAGDTEGEAIANAKEAVELWFEPTDILTGDSGATRSFIL